MQALGFKTHLLSGWHQPLADAFLNKLASAMPFDPYGRMAMAYVQSFGLKAIAPFLSKRF